MKKISSSRPSIEISIPKPCNEDWNSMSTEAKGRTCDSCATIVTDYTKMSDQQLIEHLSNSQGLGCGRFRRDQLQTRINTPLPERIWSFPRFLASGIISVVTTITSVVATSNLKARTAVEISINEETSDHPQFKTFSGIVESAGSPIAEATISIPALGIDNIKTDAFGFFSVDIPWSKADQALTLLVSHPNYLPFETDISLGTKLLKIELSPITCIIEREITLGMPIIMGEIMIEETEEPVIEPGKERVYDQRR